MISLCYVSSSVKPFSDEDIVALLEKSQRNNDHKNITGLLLYNGRGTFIQALEGDKEAVSALFYDRIKRDPRHKRVNVLVEKEIEDRSFSQWRMGYRNLSRLPPQVMKNFSSFLQEENPSDFLANNSDFACNLLLHFKNSSQEFTQ